MYSFNHCPFHQENTMHILSQPSRLFGWIILYNFGIVLQGTFFLAILYLHTLLSYPRRLLISLTHGSNVSHCDRTIVLNRDSFSVKNSIMIQIVRSPLTSEPNHPCMTGFALWFDDVYGPVDTLMAGTLMKGQTYTYSLYEYPFLARHLVITSNC